MKDFLLLIFMISLAYLLFISIGAFIATLLFPRISNEELEEFKKKS